MATGQTTRRDLLQSLGALSVLALAAPPREALAQPRVDTKGLTAKIKFESVLDGLSPS
jgi:hypothetical protein